jgi:hypothetical protein
MDIMESFTYQEGCMRYRTKRLIPIIGMLILIGLVAINVVKGDGDEQRLPLPPGVSNLAEAKLIEIKDGAGQVVLSGSFISADGDGREIERTATLSGAGAQARGKAEIEISTGDDGSKDQELEITVESLAAGAAFSVFLDGQDVARFTTDRRGGAEVEISNEPSK